MKKLLLASIFWAFSAAAVHAQVGYDLEFFDFRLEESAVEQDTVFQECTYDLKGGIRNNGPNGFPGFSNLVFNVYIHNDTAGIDNASLVPDFTLTGFDLQSISVNGSANISRPIKMHKDFVQTDTGNIVIVWPSDTYQDDNQENNYNRIPVHVDADTTECVTSGMQETYGNLSFGMYPNPAGDKLHLNLGQLTQDGIISIMDMMGHVVYSTPVNKGDMELTLPIPGDLADGLYFVSLRVGSKAGVSKLQVRR